MANIRTRKELRVLNAPLVMDSATRIYVVSMNLVPEWGEDEVNLLKQVLCTQLYLTFLNVRHV